MDVPVVKWSLKHEPPVVQEFLRRPAFSAEAETAARQVLDDIRLRGIDAVAQYAQKFDGVELPGNRFAVTRQELTAAREKVDDDFKNAAREAHRRISVFARAGLRKDWTIGTPRGGNVGEKFVPLDRVGVYVPGGAAPLVSTVLMTVTLARVAGVPEVVVCTPCNAQRKVDPYLLFAAELAGATEIYRVGGIQAIGMMAYGAAGCARVQKIVGPGGTYVTAAKRQVYGQVALDLVAGPSEIAILADETASPRFAAADLLSQAEHGTGWEKALLVTNSAAVAAGVVEELGRQAPQLSRYAAVQRVMQQGMLLAVVPNLDEGMELCNRFAPEHLEIMVREPKIWLNKVRCAGGVFIGSWTPEAAGDFIAGPSHVLPTGGTAAMFSGLTVEDFRRRSSFVAFTRADLQDTLPQIEAFGRVEGLDAHANSARVRFEAPG